MNSDASRSGRSVQFCDAKTGKVGNALLPNGIHLQSNGRTSITNLETSVERPSGVLSKDNLNSPKKPWRFPWRCSMKALRPHASLTCSQSQTSSPVTMKHTPFHSISLNFLNRSPVTSKHCVKDAVSEKSSQGTSHRKQSNFSDTEQSTDMLELYDCSEDGGTRDDNYSVILIDASPEIGNDKKTGVVGHNRIPLGGSAVSEYCDPPVCAGDASVVNNTDSRPDSLSYHSDPVCPVSLQSDSDTAEETMMSPSSVCKDNSAPVSKMSHRNGPIVFQLNGTPCHSVPLLHWHKQNGHCPCIVDDVTLDHSY